ncbi:hypothetical protein BN1013_01515 [Candidatus Rubidus massiliensis]|nr:MAG: hypothetical protein BGO10_04955 [Chlamydia sp. 32-24]CDZ80987.1 hypothetical protein BN1013_01515 [Candidatus Rubidus massiliensis]
MTVSLTNVNSWNNHISYGMRDGVNAEEPDNQQKSKTAAHWAKAGRVVGIIGLGVTITALAALAGLATYVAINALLAGAAIVAIALPFVAAGVCLASAGALADLAKRVAKEVKLIDIYLNSFFVEDENSRLLRDGARRGALVENS